MIRFVDDFTGFLKAALEVENPIIVIATEPHRASLLQRLEALGLDMATTTQERSYISVDTNEMLSKVMVNDRPDSTRFLKVASDFITEAAKAAKRRHFDLQLVENAHRVDRTR